MDKIFRVEVWFSGRVQGVGFRYQTLQVAKEFEVSGSVKNLEDGRVYLIAEGQEGEVKNFLQELESQLDSYIKSVEVNEACGERKCEGFRIDY